MSLGSLFRHIGLALGVLGSFMKQLGHQNRKKNVYDGTMWHITNIVDIRGSCGGHSGVVLGHFGVIVASLWGDFEVMWGALRAYGGAIGSPWVTLGLIWPHFVSGLGSPLGYEGGFGGFGGCFGVTLSSLRAYFWRMRMILRCLWCHLGCMKVNFQKLLIFPNEL